MSKAPGNPYDLSPYAPLAKKTERAHHNTVPHFMTGAAHTRTITTFRGRIVSMVAMEPPTPPRDTSQSTQLIKRTSSRVRKCLIETYSRELDNLSGVGVRATVGSFDVLKGRLVDRKRTFDRASAGLQMTAALIDTDDIPNNAETKPIKQWFDTVVVPNLKRLSDVQKALALPSGLGETTKKKA